MRSPHRRRPIDDAPVADHRRHRFHPTAILPTVDLDADGAERERHARGRQAAREDRGDRKTLQDVGARVLGGAKAGGPIGDGGGVHVAQGL